MMERPKPDILVGDRVGGNWEKYKALSPKGRLGEGSSSSHFRHCGRKIGGGMKL
jgi:hypothetical protein